MLYSMQLLSFYWNHVSTSVTKVLSSDQNELETNWIIYGLFRRTV